MKIRLAVSDENLEEIKSFLEEKGIEIDDDAEFILMQKNKSIGHLAVRTCDTADKAYIDIEDIIYIESYGHRMEIKTMEETYYTTDPLYQLESTLDSTKYVRISKSVIIAKRKVKQIKPSFSMKFVLIMQDGRKLEVTRNYYNSFKEAFNI